MAVAYTIEHYWVYVFEYNMLLYQTGMLLMLSFYTLQNYNINCETQNKGANKSFRTTAICAVFIIFAQK